MISRYHTVVTPMAKKTTVNGLVTDTTEECKLITSLRSSNANMHPQTEPSLVRIMACRLLGAKPLSEPMMAVYLLVPWEQFSVKFESKYCNFLSRKCFWKYCLRNGGHFVSASMCYHCPRWHPGGIVEYITGFHWVWCRLFSYWNSLSNQTTVKSLI